MLKKVYKDKGVIAKIYVKNFVTYKEVVVTPGRNLNVIIGPNGTGKSTLVSAIALGLCGTLKDLGRQRGIGISQYIKSGSDSANIEITLKIAPGKTLKIGRIIHITNKSQWTLDGKATDEKHVKEVIKSLNIQVDNLCQFLPQEQVTKFSDMDGKALLENTQKSVGDPRLHQYHQDLINSRSRVHEMTEELNQTQAYLNNKNDKLQELESVVSGIKERKATKKRIESLMQKKAWIIHDDARNALTEATRESNILRAEVTKLRKTLEPAQRQKEEKDAEIRKTKSAQERYNQQIYNHQKTFTSTLDLIEKSHAKISEIRAETKHDIEMEKAREGEINKHEIQKNKLTNDLAIFMDDCGPEDQMKVQSQKLSENIDVHRKLIENQRNELQNYQQQTTMNERKIRTLQREQKNLMDVESKRLDLLKAKSSHAWQAVMWLRDNKDKFRAKVHEPMMLSIQVKDEKYAKYFENVINQRDLIAFVCEDKTDMNNLLTYVREKQNLVINVVHSDPNEPYNSKPYVPIEEIRRFGFHNYLSSLIEAPPTIMKYLITMYHIHNIPIGSALVDENMENIPTQISRFFSPTTCYSVRISHYTGDRATSASKIWKSSLLSMVIDTASLTRINDELEALLERQNELTAVRAPIEDKIRESEDTIRDLTAQRNQLHKDITQLQTLQSKINLTAKKIAQLHKDKRSIDEIKAEAKTRIIRIVDKQIQMFDECNSIFEKAMKLSVHAEKVTLELSLLRKELAAMINDSQALQDQLKAAENRYRDLEKELAPMKRRVERLYDEAKELTNDTTPQQTVAFKKFATAFAKLPNDLDEIDQLLDTNNARVYCLKADINAENTIAEYEKLKKDVEELGEKIRTLTERLEVDEQKTRQMQIEWIPLIQKLVDSINSNFSRYFASLGCVGEVSLGKPANELNFQDYEMKIKVKFRDVDELQEFTKYRQSGGERSVTTAIYMIALQEMTRVPFRVVDEINQAMDATNERRVFDLIVKITSTPQSPQYILLTPKLLPDLSYGETVRIHTVFNGPYVLPFNKFNTIDYCRQFAARHEKDDTDTA